MLVEELAGLVIAACEAENVNHMVTGALAFNLYGIPRSTKDVDLVIDVSGERVIERIISRLEPEIEFKDQVQFDTLTWGRRHIGRPKGDTALEVELFELFDDPFVKEQFSRRQQRKSGQIKLTTWVPTAEDIVVQKIRWGRSKDLDDARDVLAVQEVEALDMEYIKKWCVAHGTLAKLETILSELPKL